MSSAVPAAGDRRRVRRSISDRARRLPPSSRHAWLTTTVSGVANLRRCRASSRSGPCPTLGDASLPSARPRVAALAHIRIPRDARRSSRSGIPQPDGARMAASGGRWIAADEDAEPRWSGARSGSIPSTYVPHPHHFCRPSPRRHPARSDSAQRHDSGGRPSRLCRSTRCSSTQQHSATRPPRTPLPTPPARSSWSGCTCLGLCGECWSVGHFRTDRRGAPRCCLRVRAL